MAKENNSGVDRKLLEELGFPEPMIREAELREEQGLLDVKPPEDLCEKVMEKVIKAHPDIFKS